MKRKHRLTGRFIKLISFSLILSLIFCSFAGAADVLVNVEAYETAVDTRVKNILLYAETAVSGVDTVLLLSTHNGSMVERQLYRTGTDVSYSGMNVEGDASGSTGYTSGTFLFEERFNAPESMTAATAFSYISFDFFSAENYSGTSLTSSSVRMYEVFLGDVNEDGVIDSTDSNLALKYSVGSVSFTKKQLISGDVNRDGLNNADDALLILQYVNEKIGSFWYTGDIVELPTTENPDITSSGCYRIRNVFSDKVLRPVSAASGSSVKQYTYSGSTLERFMIIYAGAGTYKILLYNNLDYALAMPSTTSTSPVLTQNVEPTTGVDALTQKWYIVESESGYQLINAADTEAFLTCNGSSTSGGNVYLKENLTGSEWTLQYFSPSQGTADHNIRINCYYDNGYNVRYPDNPSSYILNRQRDINKMFFSVFGVSVTINNPTLITSTADTCCGLDDDGITEEDLDDWCTLSGDCNTTHHRSISYVTSNFRAWRREQEGDVGDSVDLDEIQDIYIMMSGYALCSVNTGGTHSNNYTIGLTEISYIEEYKKIYDPSCVVAVPLSEGSPDERLIRSTVVSAHEQSHAIGAFKRDGYPVDTRHEGEDLNCVMGYENNSNLIAWRILNHQYDDVYCDSCKTQINTYLDTYY